MVGLVSYMTSASPSDPPLEAAAALERAVPMLVRWFTRSDVETVDAGAHGSGAFRRPMPGCWGGSPTPDPVRLSELAEWQEVDRSTMTTQVRRLETMGLVARASDPRDGRAVLSRHPRRGRAPPAYEADRPHRVRDTPGRLVRGRPRASCARRSPFGRDPRTTQGRRSPYRLKAAERSGAA